jgi:hypothetical protein
LVDSSISSWVFFFFLFFSWMENFQKKTKKKGETKINWVMAGQWIWHNLIKYIILFFFFKVRWSFYRLELS